MWRDLWFDDDMTARVNRMLAGGVVKIDRATGLITIKADDLAGGSNWLFFGNTHCGHDCFVWHNLMFTHFDLVPEFCRLRCYKVVVRIKTIEALLRFYNFAQSIPLLAEFHSPIHGKCGIDTRWYTDSPYDAFFYCDGIEEGREKYRIVRELVNKHFEEGEERFPIILKRSCTEFEQKYGPTDGDYWKEMSREDRDLQKHLEGIIAPTAMPTNQPDWLKNKIIRYWIEFANMMGDKTWVGYYGGKDFMTMKAVTYHEQLEPKVEGGEQVVLPLGGRVRKKRDRKGQFAKKNKK